MREYDYPVHWSRRAFNQTLDGDFGSFMITSSQLRTSFGDLAPLDRLPEYRHARGT
jgi:hypothetical protein